jgi:hypothetical protein
MRLRKSNRKRKNKNEFQGHSDQVHGRFYLVFFNDDETPIDLRRFDRFITASTVIKCN